MNKIHTALELYNEPLPKNPEWITGGVLIKNSVLLMGGEGKIYKTFLALEMAHCLTTGENLWGIPQFKIPKPCRVLYFDYELGPYGFHNRIKDKFDGYLPNENLLICSRPLEVWPDLPKGVANLTQLIDEHKINILFFDPVTLSMFYDESHESVNRLFKSLTEILAHKQDLSIVFIHHFTKPAEGADPLEAYNFRGAAKWKDGPDTIITVTSKQLRGGGDRLKYTTRWTLRHGPPIEDDLELTLKENFRVEYKRKRFLKIV